MRASRMASPPVQPISSSSSGTGSVKTTYEPKFVTWRATGPPPGGGGIHRDDDLRSANAAARCRDLSAPDAKRGRLLVQLDACIDCGAAQCVHEPRRLHRRAVREIDAARGRPASGLARRLRGVEGTACSARADLGGSRDRAVDGIVLRRARPTPSASRTRAARRPRRAPRRTRARPARSARRHVRVAAHAPRPSSGSRSASPAQ